MSLERTGVTVRFILSASNLFMTEVLTRYCRCQILVVETDAKFRICQSSVHYDSFFHSTTSKLPQDSDDSVNTSSVNLPLR